MPPRPRDQYRPEYEPSMTMDVYMSRRTVTEQAALIL
jgi:hypothetical protein